MHRKNNPNKLRVDLLWNYTAFTLAAMSALGMNLYISIFYGPEALGAFNQVYAIYGVVSQLGALGIHYSVLHHISKTECHRQQSTELVNALVPVFLLSAVSSIALFTGRNHLGVLLESPNVAQGIAWAAFGIFLFPINKVFLAYLNGKRKMKAFAVAQLLRCLFLFVGAALPSWTSLPTVSIPLAFTLAETAVLIFCLIASREPNPFFLSLERMKTHVAFGRQGLLSGAALELNAQIDVLMLGLFVSDSLVGVYSFAAMIAEGFVQLLVVLRNNLNPVLGRLLAQGKPEAVQTLVQQTQKRVILYSVLLAAVILGSFPLVLELLQLDPAFYASWKVLGLLLMGTTLVSPFIPFGTLLIQGGHPVTQTISDVSTTLTNGALNLLLIPLFGIYGAACASATAMVARSLYTAYFVRLKTGIRLVPLTSS